MNLVPELIECTICSVEIEKGGGPGGLAWHRCDPSRKSTAVDADAGMAALHALAAKADLTAEEAIQGIMRLALLRALSDDFDSRDWGDFIAGCAKFSGEGGSQDGNLQNLLGWMGK
ncbi:MAG: hypothetical protein KAI25_00235 [Hyphomicrobiaceae bacterium]|nr:hypothetical protein [Hyphomicrobiaceae bacterium]